MSQEIETYNPKDFAQVLQIIEQRRSQAVQAVNQASLLTAWEVGAFVSDRIKNAQWGAKVVQQLAEYIHTQNPTLKGWSARTIYRMVQFYETYSAISFAERATSLKLMPAKQEIVSTPLTQIGHNMIVSTPLTQIPELLLRTSWSNHLAILNRCSTIDQQIFYILYAEYEHLKFKELERAIRTDAYSRVLADKKFQSQMARNLWVYLYTQIGVKSAKSMSAGSEAEGRKTSYGASDEHPISIRWNKVELSYMEVCGNDGIAAYVGVRTGVGMKSATVLQKFKYK